MRHELAFYGKVYTDMDWYSGQLKFIKKHSFYTFAAQAQYDAQKLLNIGALTDLVDLAKLNP